MTLNKLLGMPACAAVSSNLIWSSSSTVDEFYNKIDYLPWRNFLSLEFGINFLTLIFGDIRISL